MNSTVNFADRLAETITRKQSVVVLGVDPQLDTPEVPGVPEEYTLTRFCCDIVEACAESAVAIKLQLAFFEARGIEGMHALGEVIAFSRRLGLITIADAKRADVGSTSNAYAEAYLGRGRFGCDAVTVNPYLGSDTLAPFFAKVRDGHGIFVLVKTSNPSSGEFQDVPVEGGGALWEEVARRVDGWGTDFVGTSGLSQVGAVVGATYPAHAKRARALMRRAVILAPGYGAQGASAADAVAAARADGSGILVNASRTLMYAHRRRPGLDPALAAEEACEAMRLALNEALARSTMATPADR